MTLNRWRRAFTAFLAVVSLALGAVVSSSSLPMPDGPRLSGETRHLVAALPHTEALADRGSWIDGKASGNPAALPPAPFSLAERPSRGLPLPGLHTSPAGVVATFHRARAPPVS